MFAIKLYDRPYTKNIAIAKEHLSMLERQRHHAKG